MSEAPLSVRETIPSLDGVRALAVTLVFLAHSGLQAIVPGGLGVTIFFVLSGFLITTLLRVEYAKTGSICFARFYARRFLRLMPPLFIVTALVVGLSYAGQVEPFTLNGLLSTLFYFGNYFVIATDFHGVPDGIGVVWSLAVEEHFYLFYPPLAVLLLRINRGMTTQIVVVALCLAVLAWRFWIASNGAPIGRAEDYLSMASDTRIDSILIGCLMGLRFNPWLSRSVRSSTRTAPQSMLLIFSVLLILASVLIRDEWFRQTIRYTLQSVAIAVLLYFAIAHADRAPFKWLNHPVLVYLGTVSYAIYLVHHVVIRLIESNLPRLNAFATALLAVAVTLCIVEPIRRFIEAPCARLRTRLHHSIEKAPQPMQTLNEATSRGAL